MPVMAVGNSCLVLCCISEASDNWSSVKAGPAPGVVFC